MRIMTSTRHARELSRNVSLAALSLLLALLLASAAQAETKTWVGGVSGDWSNSANWLGFVTPQDGDTIRFDENTLSNNPDTHNNIRLFTGIKIVVDKCGFKAGISKDNGFGVSLAAGTGIDMSKALHDMVIGAPLAIEGDQTWLIKGGTSLEYDNGAALGAFGLTLDSGVAGQPGGLFLADFGNFGLNNLTALTITRCKIETHSQTFKCPITLNDGIIFWDQGDITLDTGSSVTSTGNSNLDAETGGGWPLVLTGNRTFNVISGTLTSLGAMRGFLADGSDAVFTKEGAGTFYYTGGGDQSAKAMKGGLVINGGIYKGKVGATNSLNTIPVTVNKNATWDTSYPNDTYEDIGSLTLNDGTVFDSSASVVPPVQSAQLRFSGPAGTDAIVSTGASSFANPVTFFYSPKNIRVTSGTLTWGGPITNFPDGFALTKVGAGTLRLTNTAANYNTTSTTVNEGALSLADSVVLNNDATVNSGGTLTGTGRFTGNVTVYNSGTLLPAIPGGTTLTDGGNLTLFGGSTFSIPLSGTSAGELIVNGNSINLGGSTLALTGVVHGGGPYTIISNLGTPAVIGAFGNVGQGGTLTSDGGATFSINYFGGPSFRDVVLTLVSSPPAITCPADQTAAAPMNQCSAAATYTVPTPTSVGTCTNLILPATCAPASGSPFPVGVTTVTCSATDDCGTSTCTFKITVTDSQPPTFAACHDPITQGADAGACTAVVTYATPTPIDNCIGATASCSPASGSAFLQGATTVTCTATDASDNAAACTFMVTVHDTGAPSPGCPSDIVTGTDANGTGAVVSFSTTPTDNCDASVTAACAPASDTTFALGTTTVTCSSTDSSNNTGTCSFTVTVTQNPPTQFSIETVADGTGSVVTGVTLAAGDQLTLYAIGRDKNGVFVNNLAADDGWSLYSSSGGVTGSDLIAASDGKSATFTANLVGTAQIQAVSSTLSLALTGTITVQIGTAAKVSVETSDDGTGTVAGGEVISGSSITVFAISRDLGGNFTGNVTASWSLQSNSGGVLGGDLTPNPVDGMSAVFKGARVGTAVIQASSPGLTAGDSETISVTAGAPSQVFVETQVDGMGTVVPAQNIGSGSALTVFAISRDAAGNFTGTVAASWSLVNPSGAGDSQVVASFDPISAVFTAGIDTGSVQIEANSASFGPALSGVLTVVPPPTHVLVETESDGSGSVLGVQTLMSGNSITVFAISRDGGGNFVANVAASWTVFATSGGIGSGDLSVSSGTSTVFTGHVIGAGTIHAESGSLMPGDSETITVHAGNPAKVFVETAADGGGSVVGVQSVPSGNSFAVFAVSRDASNNFVASMAASWTVATLSGGVGSGDLSVSSGMSTVFTGHVAGSGTIHATSGTLMPGDSGTITVTAAAVATQVRIETLANGNGTVVGNQTLVSGSSLTVFAISRDASNNYVGNVAASWTVATTSGGLANSDLSASHGMSTVFTGHAAGTGTIHAVSAGLTGDSGLITVTAAAVATQVSIETLANGNGTVVGNQTLVSGSSLTVFAISRDASNNFVANVAASWTVVATSGGLANSDLSASSGMSTVFTGHVAGSGTIHAASGTLTPGDSGTITVTAAAVATQVRIETLASGNGTVVGNLSLASGTSLTVFAISRDANNNFVANVAASWTVVNTSGGVASSDLSVSNGMSTVFTGHAVGSGQIEAAAVGFIPVDSGTITVNSALMITSQPTTTPSTASVGQSVTFTVGAAGNTLLFSWDFHDGSPAAAGASVTHMFTTPGPHTATVTVTDSHGVAITATATVTVNAALYVTGNPDDSGADTDGDGFSDKFETAATASLAGLADPNDGTKTPLDKNGKAIAPLGLTVKSLSIKLSFLTPLKDTIQLKGSLPVAASALPLTGHKVVVDVGGYIAAYTLDIKGKSPKSTTNSFTLGAKPNKKTGLSTYTFKVLKSTVASFFADDGLTTTATANSLVNIPVTVLFNDAGFQKTQSLHFTPARGTTGKTKP